MEFDKFETKPYIKAMKSEIEISYPTEITEIIKARRAAAKIQSSSTSGQTGRQSVTPEPFLRPGSIPLSETVLESSSAPIEEIAPNNMALGN